MRRFATPLSLFVVIVSLGVTSASADSAALIAHSRLLEQVDLQISRELSSVQTTATHEKVDKANSEHKSQLSKPSLRNEKQKSQDGNLVSRHLEHNFKYEPKPYYTQYQSQSSISKGQKIGLVAAAVLTISLAIYSCILRYELSTLNVYSLLGMHTDTEQEDEDKVGNAYERRVEMI
ncbi:hypothetical protein HJC23_013129 [Cyclotella cryptica]|uniref:Uncharacterized protein n=1 Tax=Cyclotella cryptica TaxID=29204 RepID=A0ABD3QMJ6_9STRA